MKQLTKNFHRKEFDCKDGTKVPDELKSNLIKLAVNLQKIRDTINTPIVINSGYRTESHNKLEKGAKFSRHLTAEAADLKQNKLTPLEFYELLEKLMDNGDIEQGGLFLYNTFVHYDVRGIRARGNYSNIWTLE